MRGGANNIFRSIFTISGGVVDPPPAINFFQQKIKQYSSCPEKKVFVKASLLYYIFLGHLYSLSAKSNNIHILSPKRLRGEGQSLGDKSPKNLLTPSLRKTFSLKHILIIFLSKAVGKKRF